MGTPTVADWLDFMPETVTVFAYTGHDVTSKPTYSTTGVDYYARIEMKNRLIVADNGQEVMARGRVFMGTTTAPNVKDKIQLPVGYSPRTPPILAVNLVSDESGTHHVTLEIG